MLYLIVDSHIFYLLLIRIWFYFRLLISTINTILFRKIFHNTDTMISPTLQINYIIRYHNNSGHIRLFLHEDPV